MHGCAITAQSMVDGRNPVMNTVKTHFIVNGFAICSTRIREGGVQGYASAKMFKTILHEDCVCEKCKARFLKMTGNK